MREVGELDLQLPSKMREALCKMSNIRPLRSNRRAPVRFSRLRSWLGVRGLVTTNQVRIVRLSAGENFFGLADPTKYLGSGRARVPSTRPTPSAHGRRGQRRNSGRVVGFHGVARGPQHTIPRLTTPAER